MSKNGDGESDHNVTMDEGSSNDGYSDDGINYRQYSDTMLYNVPDEMRPYVRRLVKDSARAYASLEPIRRRVVHNPIVQDQRETCMYENCNKLTSGKCGRCHVFLCTDSENDCFKKFHEID